MIEFLNLALMMMAAAATPPLADPAALSSATQVTSVWDFIVKGGIVMIPIGICSLVMLAVLAERAIVLRRRNVIPPDFMTGLEHALAGHASVDERRRLALQYCKNNASPIASICAAGIRRLGSSSDVIEKHVASEGEHQVFRMRRNARALAVIAAIAPLLGLLGTILGMITAFQTVAISGEALGKTEMLAGGIYEAMITTAAGLIVALPAIIGHHWVSSRVEHLVVAMDRIAFDLVDLVSGAHAPRTAKAISNSHADPSAAHEEIVARRPIEHALGAEA